jgi:hypothetical protein
MVAGNATINMKNNNDTIELCSKVDSSLLNCISFGQLQVAGQSIKQCLAASTDNSFFKFLPSPHFRLNRSTPLLTLWTNFLFARLPLNRAFFV